MAWSLKDLENAKSKGLKVDGLAKVQPIKIKKVEKISVEKNTIEFILMSFKQKELISDYVVEHQFDNKRRYRFDWAIIDLKLAIEYEGIFSDKSRHTSVNGFSNDCIKYNLAVSQGWRIFRYTALNYQDLEADLLKIIEFENLFKVNT